MKRRLTDRQLEVLGFAHDFFRRNDQLPTPTALARRWGCSSAAGMEMLNRLASRGYLERNEIGGWRFAREITA